MTKPESATIDSAAEASLVRRVVRNFLTLGVGEALARLMAFAATVYLARTVGSQAYGVLAFAACLHLYLWRLVDFAIEFVGSKEVARHPQDAERIASAVLTVRFALACGIALLALGVIQIGFPAPERTVCSLYLLILLPIALNAKWIHLGRETTLAVTVARVIGEITALAVILLVVRVAGDIWRVPLAQFAGEVLIAVILWATLRAKTFRIGIRWDLPTALPVFRTAWPLLLQLLLTLLTFNADMVMLWIFRDRQNVGEYAVAYLLISFFGNLALAYTSSLLPTLSRVRDDQRQAEGLYQTALAQTFTVCLPVAVGGYLIAQPVIALAFGADYTQAPGALQILVWTILISSLRNVPWAALIACSRQRTLLNLTAAAAALNIGLNLILIPTFGLRGAALATVITETSALVAMAYCAGSVGFGFCSLRRLWPSSLASVVMGLVVWLAGLSLVPSIALGGLIVVIVMVATGAIRWNGAIPSLNI